MGGNRVGPKKEKGTELVLVDDLVVLDDVGVHDALHHDDCLDRDLHLDMLVLSNDLLHDPLDFEWHLLWGAR